MKTPKKVSTNEQSISNAEAKLGIRYPDVIRERLLETNGFEWGGFRFYPVLDLEDMQHTFDDVVRENTNPDGWAKYLTEGFVCIADSDSDQLLLNTNKDGKIYYRQNGSLSDDGHDTSYTEDTLTIFLDQNDLFFELTTATEEKYFIKYLISSLKDEKPYILAFHSDPVLDDPLRAIVYASTVNIGETLDEVIEKDFQGLIKPGSWELVDVSDGGTDFDEEGEELVRYNLVIKIDDFDTKDKRFEALNNAYMSWVDASAFDEVE